MSSPFIPNTEANRLLLMGSERVWWSWNICFVVIYNNRSFKKNRFCLVSGQSCRGPLKIRSDMKGHAGRPEMSVVDDDEDDSVLYPAESLVAAVFHQEWRIMGRDWCWFLATMSFTGKVLKKQLGRGGGGGSPWHLKKTTEWKDWDTQWGWGVDDCCASQLCICYSPRSGRNC